MFRHLRTQNSTIGESRWQNICGIIFNDSVSTDLYPTGILLFTKFPSLLLIFENLGTLHQKKAPGLNLRQAFIKRNN